MEAYEGSKPIKIVDKPMVSKEATSVAFRPIRSPKCPNNADPTGRAIKARPKVANDCNMATWASDAVKNNLGNTSTAAVPKI